MTRRPITLAALALITAVVAADWARTPPNPWIAPAALALGSNLTQSGGFCGALPD